MQVSLLWLKDYVHIEREPADLASALVLLVGAFLLLAAAGLLLFMSLVQFTAPYVLFSWALQRVPAHQAALIVLLEALLNPKEKDDPEGFLIGVFSFRAPEEAKRRAARETLLHFGFKRIAQNTYINGVIDTSGLEALQQLHRTLKRRDIALVLANVNDQPLSLMRRSGFEALIGAFDSRQLGRGCSHRCRH